MSPEEARLLRVATVLVGGSGLVLLWLREVLRPADEWAVVNHPWQPHVQHLHILAAPLLVFAVAMVWRQHVAPGLAGRRNGRSRTGWTLALAFAPMVISGALVQVAIDPTWRRAWSWTHVAASVLFVAATVLHTLARRSGPG